jgi:hypothetical protein
MAIPPLSRALALATHVGDTSFYHTGSIERAQKAWPMSFI